MKLKKICSFFITILLAFFPTSISFAEEESTDIASSQINTPKLSAPITIVAIKNNVPFSFTLADGTITGLYVEFWELWSQTNNIPINIELKSFEEGIELARRKNIIHSGIFKSEQRAQWADFSLPIHSIRTGLVYSREFSQTKNLRDLKGQKIATQVGSYQAKYLAEHYPDIELVLYENSNTIFNQLLNNEVQAIVGEIPGLKAQLSKFGLTGVLNLSSEELLINKVYAAFAKNQPELKKRIDEGIKNIPVNQLIELEKIWLPNLSPFYVNKVPFTALTLAEQEWLLSNDHFSLGVDWALPPFEYIDKTGSFKGISSDYISHLEKTLNIDFKIVRNKSWSALLEGLKQGNVDVMSGVVKTQQRAKKMNFTKPYISMPTVLVIRKDNFYAENLESFNNRTLGIVNGYLWIDLIKIDYPLVKIQTFSSVTKGLKSLHSGKIDGFIEAIAVVNYEINENELDNLVISSFTPYRLELSMAVRKGLEPLVTLLDKAISSMDEKQKNAIANNWLRVSIQTGTETKTILLYGLPLVGMFIIIILVIVRINKRMYREIFERKKAEQSFKNAKTAAEFANQAKGNFLANMSHEIRTPMNAIIGVAHLLEQSELNKDQQNYIGILKNSSASLVILINDILDLSKIESGKLEIEKAPFQLQMLLTNIGNQMMLEIDLNNINYELTYDDNIPEILLGDSHRLSQILLNVIKNACKFTSKGNISINVSLENKIDTSKTNSEAEVLFKISDSGIGMTTEQMEKLFETYSQADSSTTRKYGGTGLGLSISKELTELMGGTIWAKSLPNQGSTFYIKVMLNTLENKDPVEEEISSKLTIKDKSAKVKKKSIYQNYPQIKGKHILLVDDNEVNIIVVKEILKKAGAVISTAVNGKEAVDLVELQEFDAILMDIQMPVMDGYTATKQIRSNPKHTELKIIALSANAMNKDIELSSQAGMDAHLSKPINIKHLLSTLSHYLE